MDKFDPMTMGKSFGELWDYMGKAAALKTKQIEVVLGKTEFRNRIAASLRDDTKP
jgi:hypothetical protein